jgi:hypothetical protein
MIWHVWLAAAVAYVLFIAWYFNWRGPLTAGEIEKFLAAFKVGSDAKNTELAVFKAFLEQDDGKEFVMANLVRLYEDDVAHPVTGAMLPASTLIRQYFRPFMKAMIMRGGHPAYQAVKKGGFVDSWNVEPDPGFGIAAMVRYRSRRDLAELLLDPRFKEAHLFKLAAIEKTASFPTHMVFSTFMRPKYWVPGVLILVASLIQNFALLG